MPTRPLASLSPVSPHNVMAWVLHLGGIGLIPLGLLDNSVVPLPGSMDVATILLAARDKQLWFYYAAMATLGSVIGGYVTYRIARKGGEEALRKRFSKRKVQKVLKTFERWGFLAIVVPAMLPPPLPIVPFLIAAGAMQYSRTKFLTALTIGRLIRYTIFAFLGATYGREIISLFTRHGYAVLFVALGASVAAVIIVLLVRKYRK
ncbi:MAG: rane protein [Candidatus Acidoferrum typicum]|nr:rane protein [Candidatus Acidoferrum typicum]